MQQHGVAFMTNSQAEFWFCPFSVSIPAFWCVRVIVTTSETNSALQSNIWAKPALADACGVADDGTPKLFTGCGNLVLRPRQAIRNVVGVVTFE